MSSDVKSLFDSLPNEQVANQLRNSYNNVTAALAVLEPQIKTKPGNAYICTKLWDQHHTLVAEAQRYLQLQDESAALIDEAFLNLEREAISLLTNKVAVPLRLTFTELIADPKDRQRYERELRSYLQDYVQGVIETRQAVRTKLQAELEG